MNDKIVTVLFRGGLHARVERYKFFQYDTGRKLYFGDVELPFSYEVHFANKLHGVDAMTQIGDSSGVDVPANVLKSGEDVYAWLWLDGMTEGVIYIPVDKRAKPGNPAPEPDPPDIIEQALSVLNEGIDHVDEALEDAETARDGAEASASAAQASATQAASSASNAATSALSSSDSASSAAASAISSSDSASSAAASASVASGKAAEASDRATIALTSANIAQTAATTATNVLNNIDDAIDTALTEAKESGEFDGPKGDKGDPGDDGYSPIAAVTQLSSGATITITDQNGTTTANIFNGHDGIPGRDGVNGAPGQDGFSPTAMVSKSGDTATISITDANGTTTATIQDGATGQTGPQGDPGTPGVGVPTGGTAGQILAKKTGTNYDTEWQDMPESGEAFYVTFTYTIDQTGESVYTADKTFAEISEAISDGKNVVGVVAYSDNGLINYYYLNIGYYDSVAIMFYSISDGTLEYLSVDSNDEVEHELSGQVAFVDDNSGVHSYSLTWSADKLSRVTLPTGGTTGQVLAKASGTDYDTEWTTPSGGDVTDVQVNGVSVLSDGVANVPVASSSNVGVVRTLSDRGITMTGNAVSIYPASDSNVKNGTNGYRPIVPASQHESTFYGLAKAAGDTTQSQSSNAVGTYTESAKSAISQMLNSPVTVTGSTPTITALSGVRYVCGEVATLDITLPASGCVDVTFESGSTATVLTITPPTGQTVKWANGFDPTALDADTTYEINIADGLGVAGSWT